MSRSSSVVPTPYPPTKTGKTSEESKSSSNVNPFKALTNLKRFSALPRAPSFVSTVPSSISLESRTPSPLLKPARKLPPHLKSKSPWPAALQYNDVTSKRNPMDRCRGYAGKINELAMYDCGLNEWMVAMKCRGKFPFIGCPILTHWKYSQALVPALPKHHQDHSQPHRSIIVPSPDTPLTVP